MAHKTEKKKNIKFIHMCLVRNLARVIVMRGASLALTQLAQSLFPFDGI